MNTHIKSTMNNVLDSTVFDEFPARGARFTIPQFTNRVDPNDDEQTLFSWNVFGNLPKDTTFCMTTRLTF